VVDAGRIITAGGIASGMEMGLYLLLRAGYSQEWIEDTARIMEYHQAYDMYKNDVELRAPMS
jgi:transcriptional regulator GlxA family with amidase domain